MLSCFVYISYAYTGWNAASYLAGEIEQPQRRLPRAILLGTGLVVALYLALNTVYGLALPAADIRAIVDDPANPQAQARRRRADRPAGGRAPVRARLADPLSIAVGLTLLASVSAYILTGPRVAYAMAQAGQFPAVAGRLSPRTGTPAIATACRSPGPGAALDRVVRPTPDLRSVGLALFSMLTVGAVFVLRWRGPTSPGRSGPPAIPSPRRSTSPRPA